MLDDSWFDNRKNRGKLIIFTSLFPIVWFLSCFLLPDNPIQKLSNYLVLKYFIVVCIPLFGVLSLIVGIQKICGHERRFFHILSLLTYASWFIASGYLHFNIYSNDYIEQAINYLARRSYWWFELLGFLSVLAMTFCAVTILMETLENRDTRST